jgi:hypothetical protein
MAERWGVPDWRDAAAYPCEPDELSPRNWWWEFTRRRPDYRELWEHPSNGWMEGEGDDERFPADRQDLAMRFQMGFLLNPRKAYRADFRLIACYRALNAPVLSASGLTHSALADAEQLVTKLGADALALEIEATRKNAASAEESGVALYQFDLSKPLGPQIERAHNQLEFLQRRRFGKQNTRKKRTEGWALFLRALDAREDGASYREMRDVFWPGRAIRKDGKEEKTAQSARDVFLAACELRDNFPI